MSKTSERISLMAHSPSVLMWTHKSPSAEWLAVCKGVEGEANHARRGALQLWRRQRRPRAAASLRSGRIRWPSRAETGRIRDAFDDKDASDPPCTKTGRITDTFRDRDTKFERKGPGGAPSKGGAPRFPRSDSPARREPRRNEPTKARFVSLSSKASRNRTFPAQVTRQPRRARRRRRPARSPRTVSTFTKSLAFIRCKRCWT